jgi:hypothetical protein
MRRKRLWLAGLVLLTLVLALPLLLNLDAFHHQLHRALERELGRKVEFGSLSGQLLPRPGLIGRRVLVYDQEEFGAEPFLYAEEVRCDLSFRTLWSMRLSFAGIHFHQPSINLARSSEGNWNVATFLFDRHEALAPGALPVISVGRGRVNFKLGSDKQLYALRGVRLLLLPLPQRRWRLELEATPFRTDQRLAEMGELRLAGEVGHGSEFATIPFQFQASYAEASLAQLWALASGREPPVRATTTLNAALEGTPAAWTLKGDAIVSNLRRWDLVAPPRNPRWQADFDLTYTTAGSTLEVRKLLARSEQSQVVVNGRVDDLLGARRWDLEVNADLVIAELKEQYAALKVNVADQLQLEGRVLAKLTLRGPPEKWTGELTAPTDIAVKVPGMANTVRASGLNIRVGGGRLELLPLTIAFDSEHLLLSRGEISSFSRGFPYKLEWTSTGVELDPLRRTAVAFGWDLFGPSRWEGRAEIELESRGQLLAEAEPRWQGEVRLQEVQFSPPELNQPLELVEARLRWQGARFEAAPIVVRLGQDTVAGSLRRRGRVDRWSVEIRAERLKLEDLDQFVNPGRQGLLARLVGLRPRQETRWREFSATGNVEIGELKAGPFILRRFTARGDWMEGFLELAGLRFRAYGGRFRGRVQSDFRLSPPRHRLAGNLKQVNLALLLAETTEWGDLFTGMLGADLSLETEGSIPSELSRQLQGRVVGVVQDGTINHLDLFSTMSAAADGEQAAAMESAKPTPLQSLAGEFRIADRQVQLDGARMITSRTALELSGSVDFDGRLDLLLQGEPLRVAGRRPTPIANRILSYSYAFSGTLERPRLALEEPLPADVQAAP